MCIQTWGGIIGAMAKVRPFGHYRWRFYTGGERLGWPWHSGLNDEFYAEIQAIGCSVFNLLKLQ